MKVPGFVQHWRNASGTRSGESLLGCDAAAVAPGESVAAVVGEGGGEEEGGGEAEHEAGKADANDTRWKRLCEPPEGADDDPGD